MTRVYRWIKINKFVSRSPPRVLQGNMVACSRREKSANELLERNQHVTRSGHTNISDTRLCRSVFSMYKHDRGGRGGTLHELITVNSSSRDTRPVRSEFNQIFSTRERDFRCDVTRPKISYRGD